MTDLPAPFAEFDELLTFLPDPDLAAETAFRARQSETGLPPRTFGRFGDLPAFLARWQAKPTPTLANPMIAVFAAGNGVAARGVSAFASDAVPQMVDAFQAGTAPITRLCAQNRINVRLFELAVAVPTADISESPAMDDRTTAATIAYGMEAVAGDPDLLGLGEMGVGNTTTAAAIFAALYGGSGADWVGPGSGVDAQTVTKKAEIVDRALALHAANLDHPLKILARLGGREIAGMLGALIAARHRNVPVLVDGFAATAAAAVAHAVNPAATAHCLFSHVSAEPGHAKALRRLEAAPLLDFGMSVGQGTGAALAAIMVRIALDLWGSTPGGQTVTDSVN